MPLPALLGCSALFPALPGHGSPLLTLTPTHCSSAGPRAPLLRSPAMVWRTPKLDCLLLQDYVRGVLSGTPQRLDRGSPSLSAHGGLFSLEEPMGCKWGSLIKASPGLGELVRGWALSACQTAQVRRGLKAASHPEEGVPRPRACQGNLCLSRLSARLPAAASESSGPKPPCIPLSHCGHLGPGVLACTASGKSQG